MTILPIKKSHFVDKCKQLCQNSVKGLLNLLLGQVLNFTYPFIITLYLLFTSKNERILKKTGDDGSKKMFQLLWRGYIGSCHFLSVSRKIIPIFHATTTSSNYRKQSIKFLKINQTTPIKRAFAKKQMI